ncbi:MAG: aldehyde ferredoxin oxidoreductase N-terminal domain-containing protein, partial [Candidatus Bathyarchaeia archaeon]
MSTNAMLMYPATPPRDIELAPRIRLIGLKGHQTNFNLIIIRNTESAIPIDDGDVRIERADQFWGLGCLDVEEAIKKDLGGDFKVACIGPAG